MIEGGDASCRQFSTNIIGRLAKYGLLSLLLHYFNSQHVLDRFRSSLLVDITPCLVNNLNYDQPKVQCSAIDCMTQYAKHGIPSCLVQFPVPQCPADVLDASRWPDVFNVLLPLFRRNSRNAEVQQACLRCISQSFERGMILLVIKGLLGVFNESQTSAARLFWKLVFSGT